MLKIIIIEDEAPLAQGLASSLRKLRPDIDILATAADVQQAVDAINNHPDIDLVFADIRLGDGYSFDVFDKVQTNAMIVFKIFKMHGRIFQAIFRAVSIVFCLCLSACHEIQVGDKQPRPLMVGVVRMRCLGCLLGRFPFAAHRGNYFFNFLAMLP